MPRFATDENFNGDMVRGLLRRNPKLDGGFFESHHTINGETASVQLLLRVPRKDARPDAVRDGRRLGVSEGLPDAADNPLVSASAHDAPFASACEAKR